MFFDIDKEIDDRRYVLLMLALQASETNEPVTVGQFLIMSETLGVSVDRDDVLSLYYLRLIDLISPTQTLPAGEDNEEVSISRVGLAVLINAAPQYLDRIVANNDLPEGTLACLVPLLDVSRVPAADRYVSTADNQELFAELAAQLETVKSELVRDQNKNELPIPVQEKRALAAELEGLIGQIRAGFVRLSDLTHRARPIVKNIADTCKDIGVITGAAYAAYEIIGKILIALF
jgi:hypothetical protein